MPPGLASLTGPDPDSVFIMNTADGIETTSTKVGDWRGVRTSQYTYVKTLMGGVVVPWLLYDNLNDPLQLVNLVDNPDYESVRLDLESRLSAWLSSVGDDFGT